MRISTEIPIRVGTTTTNASVGLGKRKQRITPDATSNHRTRYVTNKNVSTSQVTQSNYTHG